jgi:hypothetical protein
MLGELKLKAHQRGPHVVLGCKAPKGVRQEAWGHLCTHCAFRALVTKAAAELDLDPDRMSFTRTAAPPGRAWGAAWAPPPRRSPLL